jgi:hydroxyacylglutathione hydrolase
LIIEHFSVGALGCACTLIGDERSGEAILIDPGAQSEEIAKRVARHGLKVRHLLHTHAHIDHLGATEALRRRYDARAAIHRGDIPLSQTLEQQAAFLRLPTVEQPTFDDFLVDADELRLGESKLIALHTPGHTHGSMSFALESEGRYTIMTGDTLFAGGVGRWDIGGTSLADIVQSIRAKLLPYPDDTLVIPGHGPHTTIGHERATNAYLLQK